MRTIRVVIYGALGRVSKMVTNILCNEPGIEVVGAVGREVWVDRLSLADSSMAVPFSSNLEHIISTCRPDVIVDFTTPEATMSAVQAAARQGVNMIVGTTGLSDEEINEIGELASVYNVGIMVEPSLSMEGILTRHLAKVAAKYFDHAEIVELCNYRKRDAPAGTALALAKAMRAGKGEPFCLPEQGGSGDSRGGQYYGVSIHSLRLSDARIRTEAIFGNPGGMLSIRFELTSPESYRMPIVKAVKEVVGRKGLMTGDVLFGF